MNDEVLTVQSILINDMLIIPWIAFLFLGTAASELTTNDNLQIPFENVSYAIELLVPSISENSTNFFGNVTINLDKNVLPEEIELFASFEFLTINKIQFNGADLSKGNFELLNDTSIIRIRLKGLSMKEKNYFKIEYAGTVNAESNDGLYKSYFFDDVSGRNYFLATNLAPYYTRQVFPNLGESQATFDVIVKIPPEMTAIFNSKARAPVPDSEGLSRVSFFKTPKMLPSSLSLIIANLTCTQLELLFKRTRYQICHDRHNGWDWNETVTYFSKDIINETLEYFNEFTQQNYSTYMDKITHVAIPSHDFDSIAEWGIIGSGQNNIFWNESESSDSDQQRIVSSIAFQISRQWFGNLVTANSTVDQMILVRGFTEYFQYNALQNMYPSWNFDSLFTIENYQNALAEDSTEGQSDISKVRGASLMRMIEHFMQLNSWQECVRKYLAENIFQVVGVENLWKILEKFSTEKLPSSLSAIMENWLESPTYPVINVHSNGETVTVSQEPFIADGKRKKWYIPISFTKSGDSNKFQSTKPQMWLQPSSASSTLTTLHVKGDWIILNNKETGYYRVNYDTRLWNNIKNALMKSNFDGIVELKRAQIVDDLFSFAIYDKLTVYQVLDTLKFLKNDISFYTWYSAFKGYSFLLDRVGYGSDLGKAIQENLVDLLNQTYSSIDIKNISNDKEKYTDVLNAEQVLHWACKLGNKNCLEEATNLFNDFIKENVTISRNLKKFVYCNGMRYSNDSETWDFMWDMLTNSSNDAITKPNIMYGFACINDSKLLEKYLNLTITDDFTPEDVLYVFKIIREENVENLHTARDFLLKNFDEIVERIPNTKYMEIIITGIASRFTTDLEIETFKNFTKTDNLNDHYKTIFTKAINISKNNLNWLTRHKKALEYFYFYNENYSGTTTSILALVTFAFYVTFTYCFYNRDLILYLFRTSTYQQGNEMILILS